ncbi:hypothetical protein HDU82_002738 [Entophlyctis luteolus]|nr:hypothetical protein HDU82_002738 [Entophlyctis luteolus]
MNSSSNSNPQSRPRAIQPPARGSAAGPTSTATATATVAAVADSATVLGVSIRSSRANALVNQSASAFGSSLGTVASSSVSSPTRIHRIMSPYSIPASPMAVPNIPTPASGQGVSRSFARSISASYRNPQLNPHLAQLHASATRRGSLSSRSSEQHSAVSSRAPRLASPLPPLSSGPRHIQAASAAIAMNIAMPNAASVRADSMALSYRELGIFETSGINNEDGSGESAHSNSKLTQSIDIDSDGESDADQVAMSRNMTASWIHDSSDHDAVPQSVEEQTPLLMESGGRLSVLPESRFSEAKSDVTIWSLPLQFLSAVPAAMLGLLLILLDALSYGVILFPPQNLTSSIPPTAPQVGVQMFLVSTIISMITYTALSKFPGANGSMQIEIMPFLYLIVSTIEKRMLANAEALSVPVSMDGVLATIMVAFSMSTILTGIVFFALAHYKLGNIVQFFPRQVLIGCIGGIGWFLFITAVEITSRVHLEFSLQFFIDLLQPGALMVWGSAIGLAIMLKTLQRCIKSHLFVPLFYTAIPFVFYGLVFASGLSLETLREAGFLFTVEGETLPFYTLWTYFNGFRGVDWGSVFITLPIQVSLVFFALLHVPINIPALAASTNQDYDMNRELYCHAVSNFFSGLAGTPQNYIVYSNSLLVMRCGGNTRMAGALVTIGTIVLWIIGGDVIKFVPTILVGCLIFHLGIDLLIESLVETLHMPISRLEYVTIVAIVLVMGIFGFTEGIVFGVGLSVVFFVLEYARESVILDTFDASVSTVRRGIEQQEWLERMKGSVEGVKLYGFLFFGVISQVERHLDAVIEASEKSVPVQFIILDFALVKGIDFSALQGIERLKAKAASNGIQAIFCNLGKLQQTVMKSGSFADPANDTAVVFDNVQIAIEYCENELLLHAELPKTLAAAPESAQAPALLPDGETAGSRPRRHRGDSMGADNAVLANIFRDDPELVNIVGNFVTLEEFAKDAVVWDCEELVDTLIIVQTGSFVLREFYETIGDDEGITVTEKVVGSYLPGSMVGELEFFAGIKSTQQLMAVSDSSAWCISAAKFKELTQRHPLRSVSFMQICLKYAKQ